MNVSNNMCTNCHRMSVSNISSGILGTSLDFGIRATQSSPEISKRDHDQHSPMWMIPGQTSFNQNNYDAASQIKQCAENYDSAPYNNENCSITEYSTVHDEESFDPPLFPVEDLGYNMVEKITNIYFDIFHKSPNDYEMMAAANRIHSGISYEKLEKEIRGKKMRLLYRFLVSSSIVLILIGCRDDNEVTDTDSSQQDDEEIIRDEKCLEYPDIGEHLKMEELSVEGFGCYDSSDRLTIFIRCSFPDEYESILFKSVTFYSNKQKTSEIIADQNILQEDPNNSLNSIGGSFYFLLKKTDDPSVRNHKFATQG